jgi:hypothetical protein
VLFHSSAALALPAGHPGRVGAIREFVWPSGYRTHAEVLRLNDPLPFIRESMNWIRGR